MLIRLAGAALRGLLVALVIVLPALFQPGTPLDQSHLLVLMAVLAGAFTFVEYGARTPSIVEFRNAAPLNRLRYATLLSIICTAALIFKSTTAPDALSQALTACGTILFNFLDFSLSPVRAVLTITSQDLSPLMVKHAQAAAALVYALSLAAVACFALLVRTYGWPARHGAFNVWVNLPLFNPSAGGDVIERLRRDGRLNVILGFLLPFIIPMVVKATSDLINPITINDPQTLIWTLTIWAFLPASMIIRGIALQRVAGLIDEKRRRALGTDGVYQPA